MLNYGLQLKKNGRTLSNVHHKILIIHQNNSQVRDNWQTTTKEGHHNSKKVFFALCSVPTPLGYLMNDFSNVRDESIL